MYLRSKICYKYFNEVMYVRLGKQSLSWWRDCFTIHVLDAICKKNCRTVKNGSQVEINWTSYKSVFRKRKDLYCWTLPGSKLRVLEPPDNVVESGGTQEVFLLQPLKKCSVQIFTMSLFLYKSNFSVRLKRAYTESKENWLMQG